LAVSADLAVLDAAAGRWLALVVFRVEDFRAGDLLAADFLAGSAGLALAFVFALVGAGRVVLFFFAMTIPLIKSGRLRGLAFCGTLRGIQ
jgi:hypothetical protein